MIRMRQLAHASWNFDLLAVNRGGGSTNMFTMEIIKLSFAEV